VPDALPVSARVAWSYLATLLAAVGALGLVVVANATVSVLVCANATGGDDPVAGCQVGLAIWVALAGFVLCSAGTVLLVKLDLWLWAALAALVGLLVAADAVTEWWWWALAALVPAAAALASAEWGRGPAFRRAQRGMLVGLAVVALAVLVAWYLLG
jgi:hypothetical protein